MTLPPGCVRCHMGARCFIRFYIAAERACGGRPLPVGVHTSPESVRRCREKAGR